MSAWDILVRIACLPELADARYGFVPSRRGGCQLQSPAGFDCPMSPYPTCGCAAAQLLLRASYMLGRDVWMSADHWATAMCQGLGDPGCPKMAVDLGLAKAFQEGLPEHLVEGDWLVAQGWRASSGHSYLMRVVPSGEGEAELGVMILEAAGRARGGATSHGIDGIGSRTCAVPNARNWGGGWFPAGSMQPMTLDDARVAYPVLYTALLD